MPWRSVVYGCWSLSFERDAVCNVLAPVRVRSCWQRQLGTTDNNIYTVA